MALIEVRLRPVGPWRVGHRTGDRERVDVVYHSDALYSAITHAMRALGWLDEWLDSTARSAGEPAVRFSSLFPFTGKTRLITPPRTAWPPANPGKLYLESTKLAPLEIALGGPIDESRWSVDGSSECMVPSGAGTPFQVSIRSAAAVDRLIGAVEPHRIACLEFAPTAGWWGVFDVADRNWEPRVKSAFRLLADSGFGGKRSRGWGRADSPEFANAASLFPAAQPVAQNDMWWLLSVYSPHESDTVDWSRGEYSAAARAGWIDSPSGTGAKKQARMIDEGSVLSAPTLRGRAVDVAPEGFAHPVYRAGFAFAVPLPAENGARQGGEAGSRQRLVGVVQKPEETAVPEPETPTVPEPEPPPVESEPPVESKPEPPVDPEPEAPTVPESEPLPVDPEPEAPHALAPEKPDEVEG